MSLEGDMTIAVINMEDLEGENRGESMSMLHDACARWGFFWIEEHGVDKDLMAEVSRLVNQHYDIHMKQSFYESKVVAMLEQQQNKQLEIDWESCFFICHLPKSDIDQVSSISDELKAAIDAYIKQLVKLAQKLSEYISENLGLRRDYLKKTFGSGGVPFVYPECPRPDLVQGLRAHTDAGGIILLLQDSAVPGLQFLAPGSSPANPRWVSVPPTENGRIFVNLGDQVEVTSNGVYRSALHRVTATGPGEGSRLSVATFYNPLPNAVVAPAPELAYPGPYRYGDYLELYQGTKFTSDKRERLQAMNVRAHRHIP